MNCLCAILGKTLRPIKVYRKDFGQSPLLILQTLWIVGTMCHRQNLPSGRTSRHATNEDDDGFSCMLKRRLMMQPIESSFSTSSRCRTSFYVLIAIANF